MLGILLCILYETTFKVGQNFDQKRRQQRSKTLSAGQIRLFMLNYSNNNKKKGNFSIIFTNICVRECVFRFFCCCSATNLMLCKLRMHNTMVWASRRRTSIYRLFSDALARVRLIESSGASLTPGTRLAHE